jgi:hypothetical protein
MNASFFGGEKTPCANYKQCALQEYRVGHTLSILGHARQVNGRREREEAAGMEDAPAGLQRRFLLARQVVPGLHFETKSPRQLLREAFMSIFSALKRLFKSQSDAANSSPGAQAPLNAAPQGGSGTSPQSATPAGHGRVLLIHGYSAGGEDL